jgi:hypothetical protein
MKLFLLVLTLLALSLPTQAQKECFLLETLPKELRPEAEAILWKLLDSEALYTVVGGIKPMSGGFVSLYFDVDKPDQKRLEDLARILATLRDGDEVQCALMPFAIAREGKRYAEAVVFRKSALERMLTTYSEFFLPYGFSVSAARQPLAIAIAVERETTSARNRGLGYLYGYPRTAVDFFVAGQEEYARTKTITPRDFRQIPTYGKETGAFVYAVAKGVPETDEDRILRARAAGILAEYRRLRPRYFGPGKPGPAALLRHWLSRPTEKATSRP